MLRVVLLLSVMLCPLMAEALRGRTLKLGKGRWTHQIYYTLKLGKYELELAALPAGSEIYYQRNRPLLRDDFYIDMLIHYRDDEGLSTIGIAQYFNATNRNKIRIKNPLTNDDKKIIDVSQIGGVFLGGHAHQYLAVNFAFADAQPLFTSAPLPEQAELLYGRVEVVFSDGYYVVVVDAFEDEAAANPTDMQGVYVFLVAADKLTFAAEEQKQHRWWRK